MIVFLSVMKLIVYYTLRIFAVAFVGLFNPQVAVFVALLFVSDELLTWQLRRAMMKEMTENLGAMLITLDKDKDKDEDKGGHA